MEYQEYQTSLEDLQQFKRDLVSLSEHPGWRRLKGFLEDQCRLRRMAVFDIRLTGLDNCFTVAAMQGEIAGLQFVFKLLDILIVDTETEIKQRLEIDREEVRNHGTGTEFNPTD